MSSDALIQTDENTEERRHVLSANQTSHQSVTIKCCADIFGPNFRCKTVLQLIASLLLVGGLVSYYIFVVYLHRLVTKDVLLAISGMNASLVTNSFLRSTFMLDLTSGTTEWINLADVNVPRLDFASAVSSGRRSGSPFVWIAGGANQDGGLSSVERFDPHYVEWSNMADMTVTRYSFCLLAISNVDNEEVFFAIGGIGEHQIDRTSVEVFNMTTKTWTLQNEQLNTPRGGHSCILLNKYEIWTFGGTSDESHQFAEVYDISQQLPGWQKVSVSHLGRSFFGLVSVPFTDYFGNRTFYSLYSMGGPWVMTNSMSLLTGDPLHRGWESTAAHFNERRMGFGTAYVPSLMTIYVAGGYISPSYRVLHTVEGLHLNDSSVSWNPLSDIRLPLPIHGFQLVATQLQLPP